MRYIVCDIDGVLARPNPERMKLVGALPGGGTDWPKFYATDFTRDEPIRSGNELLEALWSSVSLLLEVIFVTSRRECVRKQTEEILYRCGEWGCTNRLLMRPGADERPAPQVKLDLLRGRGVTPENTLCVIDDEVDNVRAFAEAGFTTLLFREGAV